MRLLPAREEFKDGEESRGVVIGWGPRAARGLVDQVALQLLLAPNAAKRFPNSAANTDDTSATPAGKQSKALTTPNPSLGVQRMKRHPKPRETTAKLAGTMLVEEAAARVNRGDLGQVEAMLTAQTVALNAIFVDLARRAHQSKTLEYQGHYLKLAFKAQSQCRMTAESIAVL